MNPVRNASLDLLKGIAALFVIWIHEQFPGVTGQLVNRIGAFAVPVFFMVSGYFAYHADRKKLGRSVRHILRLILITYGLNLLRIVVFDGTTAAVDAVVNAFSPRTLILWVVLNITPISGVAWFLFALLYCYILHWMFHRQTQERWVYLLIPVCIAAGLAVRLLLPSVGTNNAWFCGIPCYLFGRWVRENRERLLRFPVKGWSISALAGLVALTVSVFVAELLAYPGAFVLAGSLFILCTLCPNARGGLLERIGSTYSFFVYIGHALMIHVFNAMLPIGDSMLLAWTRPVLLAAATIGCAAIRHDGIRRKK